ncbi:hypothetical protein Bbelb_035200 [Branchiostoma belcheri]|nr:hypothetical protein Bbelb_035200 [Branchiostoma belcheri]
MEQFGFRQFVQSPTTDYGSLLDHVYVRGLDEDSLLVAAIEKFAKEKPGARVWFKADACDVKVALQTSIKGKWAGDVDLGDGSLETLRTENDRRMAKANLIALLKDVEDDIAFLEVGLQGAQKKYADKFRQSNSSTELLKVLAWERVEYHTLLEQAKTFYESQNLFKKKRIAADHAMVIMMWFNYQSLAEALKPKDDEPKPGLTEAALFGLRKQSKGHSYNIKLRVKTYNGRKYLSTTPETTYEQIPDLPISDEPTPKVDRASNRQKEALDACIEKQQRSIDDQRRREGAIISSLWPDSDMKAWAAERPVPELVVTEDERRRVENLYKNFQKSNKTSEVCSTERGLLLMLPKVPQQHTHLRPRQAKRSGVFKVTSKGGISQHYHTVNFETSSTNNMPSCTCREWAKHKMPCKHFCAIFTLEEGWTWDKLSPAYRDNPLFSLDDTFLASEMENATKERSCWRPSSPEGLKHNKRSLAIGQSDRKFVSDEQENGAESFYFGEMLGMVNYLAKFTPNMSEHLGLSESWDTLMAFMEKRLIGFQAFIDRKHRSEPTTRRHTATVKQNACGTESMAVNRDVGTAGLDTNALSATVAVPEDARSSASPPPGKLPHGINPATKVPGLANQPGRENVLQDPDFVNNLRSLVTDVASSLSAKKTHSMAGHDSSDGSGKVSQDIFQREIDDAYRNCRGAIGIADDIQAYGENDETHDYNLGEERRK